MASGGFSSKRLTRVRALLEGALRLRPRASYLARRGEVHIEATGGLRVRGRRVERANQGGRSICRLASTTKPIVAACAMALVQDGTLSLDGPVDDLLPELADVAVWSIPAHWRRIPSPRSARSRCGIC